jgi:hypothetical protein
MKVKIKSCGSERSTLTPLAIVILLCFGCASTAEVFAQRRPGRPQSEYQYEGTPILPAGTNVIPDGTVLTVEMDTKLNSGTAQVSDRFLARLAIPVIDAGGRTLLDAGAIIEGHVASVKKARWAHRSGEMGLSFDYVELGNGRRIPLRATLVGGSNPINDEGDLKAKSAGKRDVLVTSGGAVAGAGVGLVTGATMLAGTGVGAAAGLTVVLIMKGKNVDIDPGERFQLELVQPMSLASRGAGAYYRGSIGTRRRSYRRPVPLQYGERYPPRSGGELFDGRGGPAYEDPNSVRTQWSRVPIFDTRAERDRDGLLRVLVTAETPTTGWRIYTNHEQAQDTLNIRLMGIPPSRYGAKRTSHPSAPTVCIEDRNSAIRRIVIHGQNSSRSLTIGQGATSAQADNFSQSAPPGQQPYYQPRSQSRRTRPRGYQYDGFSGNLPSTASPTGSLSSLARRTASQVDTLRLNYAAQVGLWVTRDGSVNVGKRRATDAERELYDTLSDLVTSARSLAAPSSRAYDKQRAVERLRDDTQNAQRMWQDVKKTGIITRTLDNEWLTALSNLRALNNAALR